MSNMTDPSDRAVAVTASDTTVLASNGNPPRALFVGVGGNLSVQFGDKATTVVFKNVPSGTWLPIRASRVMAATTATDVVALY